MTETPGGLHARFAVCALTLRTGPSQAAAQVTFYAAAPRRSGVTWHYFEAGVPKATLFHGSSFSEGNARVADSDLLPFLIAAVSCNRGCRRLSVLNMVARKLCVCNAALLMAGHAVASSGAVRTVYGESPPNTCYTAAVSFGVHPTPLQLILRARIDRVCTARLFEPYFAGQVFFFTDDTLRDGRTLDAFRAYTDSSFTHLATFPCQSLDWAYSPCFESLFEKLLSPTGLCDVPDSPVSNNACGLLLLTACCRAADSQLGCSGDMSGSNRRRCP